MKWLQETHRFVKLSNCLHVVCNTFGVHVTSRTSLDSSEWSVEIYVIYICHYLLVSNL